MHLVIIAVLLFVASFFLYKKLFNRKGTGYAVDSVMSELVGLCRGDVERAERLLNHEKSKNPRLSEKQAIENAIYFLRRDS